MAQDEIPKWQKEVEEILREKFQGDELSEQLKRANELIDLVQEVEVPSGDTGQAIGTMLKLASEELRSLAAVYAGFQLGVAWERYQNANRA